MSRPSSGRAVPCFRPAPIIFLLVPILIRLSFEIFQIGNYYGTPKPSLDSPLVLPAAPLAQSSAAVLPGAYIPDHYNNNKPLVHRPAPDIPRSSESSGGGGLLLLAGAHPSSEGKRRRNRSNVEAMAAAQNSSDAGEPGGGETMMMNQHQPGAPAPHSNNNNNNNMTIPSYREDGGGAMGGLSEAELGPLPQNWEKAYTERGEVYFIE